MESSDLLKIKRFFVCNLSTGAFRAPARRKSNAPTDSAYVALGEPPRDGRRNETPRLLNIFPYESRSHGSTVSKTELSKPDASSRHDDQAALEFQSQYLITVKLN